MGKGLLHANCPTHNLKKRKVHGERFLVDQTMIGVVLNQGNNFCVNVLLMR